jgi:hypothetical protein
MNPPRERLDTENAHRGWCQPGSVVGLPGGRHAPAVVVRLGEFTGIPTQTVCCTRFSIRSAGPSAWARRTPRSVVPVTVSSEHVGAGPPLHFGRAA